MASDTLAGDDIDWTNVPVVEFINNWESITIRSIRHNCKNYGLEKVSLLWGRDTFYVYDERLFMLATIKHELQRGIDYEYL
jgi:hypothetical protein